MPYKQVYIKPEVFLTYKKIKVFHAYEDQDWNERFDCHFTLHEDHDTEEYEDFDARELSTFKCSMPPALKGENDTPENKALWKIYFDTDQEQKDFRKAIREAIRTGELKIA